LVVVVVEDLVDEELERGDFSVGLRVWSGIDERIWSPYLLWVGCP